MKSATSNKLYGQLKMENLDATPISKLNILIYGDTGAGKTRFLGSAMKCPETAPIFFIAIDPGTESIKRMGIEVFRPQNFKEIQQAYDFLRFENRRFKSVGIDSLTEMHDKLSMGEILGVLKDDASYANLESHVPSSQYDWLQSGEQMRRNIRAFRDLAYLPNARRRIHVFMTALTRTDEKRSIVCPALPGALGLNIGASIDVLARLSIRKKRVDEKVERLRHLLLSETSDKDGNRVLAKVRTPVGSEFPDEIWRPTVARLLKYWETRKDGVPE